MKYIKKFFKFYLISSICLEKKKKKIYLYKTVLCICAHLSEQLEVIASMLKLPKIVI